MDKAKDEKVGFLKKMVLDVPSGDLHVSFDTDLEVDGYSDLNIIDKTESPDLFDDKVTGNWDRAFDEQFG